MDPKIIICGTGRAGTTLLVRILTVAGMDTGFKPHRFKGVEENLGRAGLEKPVRRHTADKLPLVVKSPQIVDVLPQLLEEGWFPDRAGHPPYERAWLCRRQPQTGARTGNRGGRRPGHGAGGALENRSA